MADRPIDRQAWAKLVAGLIATETNGKKATFARLVGVDPKTIGHWLGGTVEVSESSVRRVATALGRRPLELLVQVGYYSADEVGAEPTYDHPLDPDLQILQRKLLDPNQSEAAKATIRATIRYLAELEGPSNPGERRSA